MCDERERLIEYLYDEADAAGRRHVEAHLVECHVCRAEVAGLKNVRVDLLAWDVPSHEPIWRPVPPPRTAPMWGIPAWGIAAAAGLVVAAGLTGGMAGRVFWPTGSETLGQTQATTRSGEPVLAGAEVTPAALSALEARVLNQVRSELRQQLQAVSSREPAARTELTPVNAARTGGPNLAVVARQLSEFERWKNEQDLWRRDQIGLNAEFDRKITRLGRTTTSLDNQFTWDRERNNMLRINNVVGPDLGR